LVIRSLNNRDLVRSIDDIHKAVIDAENKAGYKTASCSTTNSDLELTGEQIQRYTEQVYEIGRLVDWRDNKSAIPRLQDMPYLVKQ
jgi:hypothetical protein